MAEEINERTSELDALAEAAQQEREDELESTEEVFEEVEDTDSYETDEPEVDEEKEEVVEEEPAEEPKEEIQEPAEEPQFIEINVGGETRKVSIDEVIEAGKRTFQKPEEKPQEEDEGPSPVDLARDKVKEARVAMTKAFADVDEEQMSKAMEDYEAAQLEYLRIETADKVSIKDEVTREMKHASIIERLEMPAEDGGYKDVLENEDAYVLMNHKINKAIAEKGEQAGFDFEVYKKAAEETRKIFSVEKDEADDFAEKKEKKEKIIDIKTAHNKTPSSVEKPKNLTRKEILNEGIAELKKGRGQFD